MSHHTPNRAVPSVAGTRARRSARSPWRATASTTVCLGLAVLGIAGCGDDEADAGGAPSAYCTGQVDLEMQAASMGDPSVDPVGHATTLLSAAKAVRGTAPAEVAHAYDEVLASLEDIVASGDPGGLESLDFSKVHAHDVEHCEWNVVDVASEDYHFTGVPSTLTAGEYSFELTNDATEFHVLLVVAKKEGVTASWDELLESPDGESQIVTLAGAGAPPGATSYAVTRLEPGEYLVLCPIPQGTSMTAEGDGPPHFVLGMRQTLTVTA